MKQEEGSPSSDEDELSGQELVDSPEVKQYLTDHLCYFNYAEIGHF